MSELSSHTEAAFGAATDLSKQVLTLSTGILATTLALADTLFGVLSDTEKKLLWASWGLYGISLLFGIWALMALAGSLGQSTPPAASAIYKANARIPALLQFGSFLVATAVLAFFSASTIGNEEKPPATTTAPATEIVALL
jgi:hypothetical protein